MWVFLFYLPKINYFLVTEVKMNKKENDFSKWGYKLLAFSFLKTDGNSFL